MTKETHRAGGMLVSVVGFTVLQQNNLLLPDINPALQWLVMYPFCMFGSVASDLDHHWKSVPVKDYPSYLIHKALHITKPLCDILDRRMGAQQKRKSILYKLSRFFNARHRSWQTHSDITLLCMLFLLRSVLSGKVLGLSSIDIPLLALIVTGLCMGVLAHLVLDILTPEGVWITPLVLIKCLVRAKNFPTKLHLVPHNSFFATGGRWEKFIRRLLHYLTILSLFWLGYVIYLAY